VFNAYFLNKMFAVKLEIAKVKVSLLSLLVSAQACIQYIKIFNKLIKPQVCKHVTNRTIFGSRVGLPIACFKLPSLNFK